MSKYYNYHERGLASKAAILAFILLWTPRLLAADTASIGNFRYTLFNAPGKVRIDTVGRYEIVANKDRYAVRAYDPGTATQYKLLAVSNYDTTFLSAMTINAEASAAERKRTGAPLITAIAEMAAGPTPNSANYYWRMPQIVSLGVVALQRPELIIEGDSLKPAGIPMLVTDEAKLGSARVRTRVRRSGDGTVEMIQFWFIRADFADGDTMPLAEGSNCLLHGELVIAEREQGIPTKMTFNRWARFGALENRYIFSTYEFDGGLVTESKDGFYQSIAYEPGTKANVVNDFRFKGGYSLLADEPPPFGGSASHRRVNALMAKRASDAADVKFRQMAALSIAGLSLIPLGFILSRKFRANKTT